MVPGICFTEIFTSLWWYRTKPKLSLRQACILGEKKKQKPVIHLHFHIHGNTVSLINSVHTQQELSSSFGENQILQFRIIQKCSQHSPVDLSFITQSIHLNSVKLLIDFILVSLNVLSQSGVQSCFHSTATGDLQQVPFIVKEATN